LRDEGADESIYAFAKGLEWQGDFLQSREEAVEKPTLILGLGGYPHYLFEGLINVLRVVAWRVMREGQPSKRVIEGITGWRRSRAKATPLNILEKIRRSLQLMLVTSITNYFAWDGWEA